MTLKIKIIILFTSMAVIITFLISSFIYLFTSQYLEKDFFQRLTVRAGVAGIAQFEATGHNVAFYNDIREKHLQRLPNEKEYIFEMPVLPQQVPPGFIIKNLGKERTISNRIKSNYYLSTVYSHNGKDYAILISAYNKLGNELLSNLRSNLIMAFILVMAAAFVASLLLSEEVIIPIRHMTENARRISASNLHLRLEKKGAAEMTDLTQTFNDMLDRLETSFETQNNFLSKAAHELRTPLTAIIGEAELALSKERTPEEYKKALQVISHEAEQLEHHTSSLLELAQAGYNSKEPFMSALRLDELLFSVKRVINFTEPENKVQILLDELPDIDDKITIAGNVNLLKLALANVVQNACKYSDCQPVNVSITSNETHAVITIKDKGIGIPGNELKYIFDPFFRASNAGRYKGYGFGLPLAQKIIRLHRGELHYESIENVGTTVEIHLPVISS